MCETNGRLGTQQLEVLHRTSLRLTTHLELEPVLEGILEGALQLASEAHSACIF